MEAKKIAFMIALYITVIGALNWGFHACGMNLVEKLANAVGGTEAKMVENGIYYVVAACGLAVGVMYTIHLVQKKDDKKQ